VKANPSKGLRFYALGVSAPAQAGALAILSWKYFPNYNVTLSRVPICFSPVFLNVFGRNIVFTWSIDFIWEFMNGKHQRGLSSSAFD
jgi:hypothetical protein